MSAAIEILVHVSARCTCTDDAKYRQQAQGFLDCFAGPQSSSSLDCAAIALPSRDEVRDALVSTDKASGQDAGVARLQEGVEGGSKRLLVSNTPLRALPTLTPQKDVPISIKETPLPARAGSEPALATVAYTCHQRSQSDSFVAPPSEVPDSQPSNTSSRKRRREQSPSVIIPMLEAALGIADVQEANKRQKLGADPSSSQLLTSRRGSPPLPTTTPTSHRTASTSGRGARIRVICPRPPPTSVSPFATHATKPLRTFASDAKLAACYAPAAWREIRPLERGHWSLQISRAVWTPEAVTKFWKFVKAFIDEGRAGWATWVEREPAAEGEQIRVWCWGDMVQEVWLMLFVASGRLVKKTDAVWIDGAGQAVLRMVGES